MVMVTGGSSGPDPITTRSQSISHTPVAVGSKWWVRWDDLSGPPFAVSFAVGARRNGLAVRVHTRVTAGIVVLGLDQVLGKLLRAYFWLVVQKQVPYLIIHKRPKGIP